MATILLQERRPGASLRYTPASYAGRVLVGHQPGSFANTTDTIDDLNFGRLRAASCLDEPLVDSNIWVPSRFIRSIPALSDWYLVRDDDLGPLEWSPATWDDTLAFVHYVRDANQAAPVRREMTAKALEASQSPGGQMDYRKRLLRLKRP